MTLVPHEFANRVPELYGQQGEEWLRLLPDLLQECARRFDVSLEAPFPDLSWNLILQATKRDGTPVVLKIAVLKAELMREMSILQAYADHGAIRVLDADAELGALMLERVEPGTPLSAIEDDGAATEIFCGVFQCLHCLPPAGQYTSIQEHFSAIEKYRRRFGHGDGDDNAPLPAHWVERAETCLAYLLSSTTEPVLLHGDLHHGNILRRGDSEWAVIDPKGIVGDRHFDVIQYLLNYEERGGDPDTVLARRITMISDRLHLDPRRIALWGITRGVLEACWIIEDGRTDWQKGIQSTERFAAYLG